MDGQRTREKRGGEEREKDEEENNSKHTDSKIQTFVVPLFKGYVSNTKSLCIMCKK